VRRMPVKRHCDNGTDFVVDTMWTPRPKTTIAGCPPRRCKWLKFLRKSGAGEGIRTLDPNLGKESFVVCEGVRRFAFSC